MSATAPSYSHEKKCSISYMGREVFDMIILNKENLIEFTTNSPS